MTLKVVATEIPGLFELWADPRPDARGCLVKTFDRTAYADAGLATTFEEELYVRSRRGVVRGMHFQTPPAEQEKVVFCEHGSVFDVAVDLRKGSPTFGGAVSRELSAERGNGLYVPAGLAQGYAVTSEEAVVSYRLTSGYAPENEGGLLWSSVGVVWPVDAPTVSERDLALPALDGFRSPFDYVARP